MIVVHYLQNLITKQSVKMANPGFDKVRSMIPNYPVVVLLGEKNPIVDLFLKRLILTNLVPLQSISLLMGKA